MVLLKQQPVDLMIVIGGYNSSNTCNLARMCAEKVPTYHIADPDCLESADAIRHRPAGGKHEVRANGWLARDRKRDGRPDSRRFDAGQSCRHDGQEADGAGGW